MQEGVIFFNTLCEVIHKLNLACLPIKNPPAGGELNSLLMIAGQNIRMKPCWNFKKTKESGGR